METLVAATQIYRFIHVDILLVQNWWNLALSNKYKESSSHNTKL